MAMRKEAPRRYASAEQLAEDLRRHLEGLPVRARKDTFGYRTSKFVKRHRAGVAAAVLVVLSLVGGIWATTRQARIAQQRFNDVRQLANSFLFEVHDSIQNLPGSTSARQLIVKRALEYLDKLSQQSGSDISLQLELAAAYVKVGDVQGNLQGANLGDTAGALASYRNAAEILERASARNAGDAKVQRTLSTVYERIAEILANTGDMAGALAIYRKNLTVYQTKAANNPADKEAQLDLAVCLEHLGDLVAEMGDAAGAIESHRKAVTMREEITARDANNPDLVHSLTRSYDNLGHLYKKNGAAALALEHYRKALRLREKLSADDPNNARGRRSLAISYAMVSDALSLQGDNNQALESVRQGLKIFEALAAADHANVQARRDVALTYKKIGDFLTFLGRPQEALENYRPCLQIRESLSANDPKNTQLLNDLMTTYNDVGDVLGHPDFVNLGDHAGALAHYRKGLEIAERLIAGDPASTQFRGDLWLSYNKIGQMQELNGDSAGALANYQKALPLAEAVVAADPEDANMQRKLSTSHELIGNLLLKTRDLAGALNSHQRALELREKLSATDPTNADFGSDLALTCSELGAVQAAMASEPKTPKVERIAHWKEAKAHYQRSLDIWRRLQKQSALVNQTYKDQPDKIAKEMARCDAALAKLQ